MRVSGSQSGYGSVVAGAVRRRRPERCASLQLGHLGRDLVGDVDRGVPRVVGARCDVDGDVVAHGQRALTGPPSPPSLVVLRVSLILTIGPTVKTTSSGWPGS